MVCANGNFHRCFQFGVGLDPVISRKTLMETKFASCLAEIETRAAALGFDMNSGMQVGELLALLAASKPGGRFLELGTGCGLGVAWLLSGMDAHSQLVSVDTDAGPQAIARDVLGADRRVTFVLEDGGAVLERTDAGSYDLIFADAWPGKFSHLDEALAALRTGGLYVVDDLLPQPNWPDGHQANVDAYLDDLRGRDGFAFTQMDWATGVVMLVKR
jgi:predicted O-methyltransferase YrrM